MEHSCNIYASTKYRCFPLRPHKKWFVQKCGRDTNKTVSKAIAPLLDNRYLKGISYGAKGYCETGREDSPQCSEVSMSWRDQKGRFANCPCIKLGYEKHEPIVLPYDNTRMITPENMLNRDLDLRGIDAPLPLAMVATKDPESPMALAALTRLSPYGKESVLAWRICQWLGKRRNTHWCGVVSNW